MYLIVNDVFMQMIANAMQLANICKIWTGFLSSPPRQDPDFYPQNITANPYRFGEIPYF